MNQFRLDSWLLIVASNVVSHKLRSVALFTSNILSPGSIGGPDTPDNLALACWQCNLKKGPNLSDIDPQTGRITSLFHPRFDLWTAHFSAKVATLTLGIEIQGLTPVGRATVQALE